jgi:hypothetical protein
MTFSAYDPRGRIGPDESLTARWQVPRAGHGCIGGPPGGGLTPDCLPDPVAQAIAAPASPRKPRATPRLIASLLADVTTAPALVRQSGVTRQRVNQILHDLLRSGKARRARAPGSSWMYHWVRTDVDAAQNLHLCRKPLPQRAVKVLSCLRPDSVHSMPQIAAHLGVSRYCVCYQTRQLTRQGLVAVTSTVRPNLIALTPSGVAHPERDVAATQAPLLDLAGILGANRAAFIETLGVLEEACTHDLTAAVLTEGRGARALLSGQMMQRLVRINMAERVDGGSGHPRRYRLTDAGKQMAAWLAQQRPSPARDDLVSKISAANTQRVLLRQERLRKSRLDAGSALSTAAQSPAQARIVRALEAGPLHTDGLRPCIADLSHHPKSIYLMLKMLAARGAIREVGLRRCGKLWSLPDGGA